MREAFSGAAFTPNQNLRYSDGFILNNGLTRTSQGSATLFSNQFNTSLTGGVKLGYFFHSIPYLGLEVESSVNNSYVNRRSLVHQPTHPGGVPGCRPQ